jgi:hypothetical protein
MGVGGRNMARSPDDGCFAVRRYIHIRVTNHQVTNCGEKPREMRRSSSRQSVASLWKQQSDVATPWPRRRLAFLRARRKRDDLRCASGAARRSRRADEERSTVSGKTRKRAQASRRFALTRPGSRCSGNRFGWSASDDGCPRATQRLVADHEIAGDHVALSVLPCA